MLDMTAWISVLGLLDECPILPAALTAVLERRTAPVSLAEVVAEPIVCIDVLSTTPLVLTVDTRTG